jgi:amino acid adenylation domain-containing protein
MEKFTKEPRFVPVDHDPFQGPEVERIIPTTEAQREVLAASEMGPEASCAYNESITLELKGELDLSAMRQAIQRLVARHESLRSTIAPSNTRMVVSISGIGGLEFIDLGELPKAERKKELEELARRDATTPFDLRKGPLFHARTIRVDANTHLLQLCGHHAVCDGWSLGIMMAEVSSLYNASRSNSAPVLPDAVPYSDFVLALLDQAKDPAQQAIESYWLELFKGGTPRLDLPTDRPRPMVRSFRGDRIDLELSPELVNGLKEVATRCGASFVTTLLTTFELLLHKLTDDSDIVVGLPAAGQSDMDMKHLVGHCVNLLALRSHVDQDRPFIEHLKARRTAVLDAFDNQRYTFGTLLKKLNVTREPGRIPLVPVVFNIDMNLDDGVAFDGLQHKLSSDPRAFENFELFLNATGSDDRLILEWSYSTDLFDEATVRSWMRELSALAARVITAPTATIGDLVGEGPVAGEKELPPASWAGTVSSIPDLSVGELFERISSDHPDRTSVEFVDRKMTYAELNEHVLALAAQLITKGVRPGDPVGLCMDRGFEMIIAMLAILRSGGCFVPFDPAYPEERLKFMFEDTDVGIIVTQRHLKGSLPSHGVTTVIPDELQAPVVEASFPKISPDAPAYIMYTSGSTGIPKGVVVPHRAIVRLVREQEFLPFGPELTFLQLSNISFDAATLEIWGALLNGGRLVLQPQQKPTLLEIVDTIERYKITTVWFTVGLFNLLVDEHLERLRGLHHILTGGDVLSVPHVKKAFKVLGPGVLINGYGPTENTTFTCCYPIEDPSIWKGSVPIGKPIGNTSVHVLDERLKHVAIGHKGELYAGGSGVALGYWKRDDLTHERFIPDPFSGVPGAMLYRTGDVVRWTADGNIEFIGRADGQVKIRGFRVELGEVENALNSFAEVKDRVVVVRNDLPGEKQLVCYVVPKDPAIIPAGEQQEELLNGIREHLRKNLPDHMVPTAFVVMDGFPLNPNGKVDRKALPAPELRSRSLRADFVGPRDDRERRLAAIWSEVLKVDRVSVRDNFFDLGGHSLLGIQLLARVEEEFGGSMALKELYLAPTVAEMALVLIEEAPSKDLTNLSIIQPDGDRFPLFCVHGDEGNFYLPKYLGKDQPFFGFFHQGEDGHPLPYQNVQSIAAHFISELKQVRPEGPYHLAGYSFGGLVAFEMAQQLQAAGDTIPMVMLLDTYAPEPYAAVMKAERKLHMPLKNLLLRALVKFIHGMGKALPTRLRHFYVIDTYDQATARYAPKRYGGQVTVIKATDSPGAPDMGWNAFASNVFMRNSSGDHYNMIMEPHVRNLADQMAQAMDMAERTSTNVVV